MNFHCRRDRVKEICFGGGGEEETQLYHTGSSFSSEKLSNVRIENMLEISHEND